MTTKRVIQVQIDFDTGMKAEARDWEVSFTFTTTAGKPITQVLAEGEARAEMLRRQVNAWTVEALEPISRWCRICNAPPGTSCDPDRMGRAAGRRLYHRSR